MTLADLRVKHAVMFYPQEWYRGEAFMFREVPTNMRAPDGVVTDPVPGFEEPLMFAATLAGLYVREPDNPVWSRYLWCADRDHLGQRIYVGGVCNDNGNLFEIHRHLHITERWGVPVWR